MYPDERQSYSTIAVRSYEINHVAARKKSRKAPEPVYTHLSVLIDRYEAGAGMAVNHLPEQPQYAYRDIDDDPLLQQVTRLT